MIPLRNLPMSKLSDMRDNEKTYFSENIVLYLSKFVVEICYFINSV